MSPGITRNEIPRNAQRAPNVLSSFSTAMSVSLTLVVFRRVRRIHQFAQLRFERGAHAFVILFGNLFLFVLVVEVSQLLQEFDAPFLVQLFF